MYILYLCLRILYLCVLTFLVFSSLFAFLASSVREQMLPPAWPCLDPRVDEIRAVALSTCVLAPGCSFWSLWWLFQESVDFRGAELFTGAALSFQMVFPVIPAWPSVPCTSAASEQTSFPVGILGSCNTKMLLKGYWSSKLCSFLSAMSVTSPEFDNYVSVSCNSSWYLIPSSVMFSDLPQTIFYGLSVSLGSSHFPSPSVEPSEGQRFLAQPSCVGIPWDVSLHLRNWEGCDAPGLEQRSGFWEHLALSMMKNPSSWLLQPGFCSIHWWV